MTASNETPARYYSTPQVAEMFDVKPATVRDWIRGGRIKAMKLPGGRHWKVSQEELERFANKRIES